MVPCAHGEALGVGVLAPLVSGDHQGVHTRCTRRQAKLLEALEVV
jgi:hypothetical protein